MNAEKCKGNKHIGKYISQLYRKGSVFINKEVPEYGIGSGQFMFLLELYINDGKNQEEIAETLKIDKGTTARALKKLEEQNSSLSPNLLKITTNVYSPNDKSILIISNILMRSFTSLCLFVYALCIYSPIK